MFNYACQLGRQPDISTAELHAVLLSMDKNINITKNTFQHLFFESQDEVDTVSLMNKLGGTIKIMMLTFPLSGEGGEALVQEVSSYLNESTPEGKIHFSLSGPNAKKTALTIKKELKSFGRSVRYIEPKNTATILHNNLVQKQTDLTIIDNKLFITTAIQPIEELSNRDYNRPGRDDKSGMLPPKLAKILINLSGAKPTDTILDPFCGSGTILMEAALMEFQHLSGSDLSKKAIADTKKNLRWLQENNKITTKQLNNTTLFTSDARSLIAHLKNSSIDAIMFEPYMGKPLTGRETKQQLTEQAKELANLYIESFKTFHKILKPEGTVTYIIPQFKYKEEWIIVPCIEQIQSVGFSIEHLSPTLESLLYHRKGQHLGRGIWKFKK